MSAWVAYLSEEKVWVQRLSQLYLVEDAVHAVTYCIVIILVI